MKILIFLLFFSTIAFTQNTIIYNDAKADSIVKTSFYARVMPYSIVTGAGSLNNAIYIKPSVAYYLEVGKSYGVLDIGIGVGSYSLNRDTTSYVEFKVTMDASQYGVFSNEINLGIGKIFYSSTPILLEASYTIMAQIYQNWGLGVTTGFYDFVGKEYDITRAYYGVFMRYDIELNVEMSMFYLSRMHKMYKDWKITFGCYNTGYPQVTNFSHKIYNHTIDWKI